MIRKVLLTLIAPALLAACGTPGVAGSAPSTSPTATVSVTPSATPTPTAIPTATPAPPPAAPSVFVASNMALGAVLVNAQGRTLYYSLPERGGRVVCTGQCTNAWPPLFSTSVVPTAGTALPAHLGFFPGPTSPRAGTWARAAPALTPIGAPRVAGSSSTALLGHSSRSDGNTQVPYNGHPLYPFVGDDKPGDTNGEGSTAFGAGWDVLSPN